MPLLLNESSNVVPKRFPDVVAAAAVPGNSNVLVDVDGGAKFIVRTKTFWTVAT